MIDTMRKIALILFVLVIVLSACGGDPSSSSYVPRPDWREVCDDFWEQLDVETGYEQETVTMLLNQEWPPDSIGFAVKECVNDGWTGWR